jgi:hypothetical protein
MKKMVLAAGLALGAAIAAPVSAHEGHAHKLMGTVTSVHTDTSHVEVKTADGKAADFYVTPETKYSSGGKAATSKDLTVGARVSVTTRMQGTKTFATEVKIGTASGEKAGPNGSPRQH